MSRQGPRPSQEERRAATVERLLSGKTCDTCARGLAELPRQPGCPVFLYAPTPRRTINTCARWLSVDWRLRVAAGVE